MAISKDAHAAMESIVGSEYICDDPVVMEAYCGGRMGHGKDLAIDREMNQLPACVVMPKTTKEVQAIVQLANRYNIPYVPSSTYWVTHCSAKRDDQIIIDSPPLMYGDDSSILGSICDATLLAIRAAYQGIELDSIEVSVVKVGMIATATSTGIVAWS